MLFPITTVCLALCLVWTYRRYGRRNALTLALGVWALGVVLMSLPIFEYTVAYSTKPDLFVAACLVAVTLSYHIARRQPRPAPSTSWNRRTEVTLAMILGAAGIVGCLMLLADAAATGTQLSISYLLENLTVIREESFQRLAEGARPSPLVFGGNYLACCSIFSVIAAAKLGGRPLVLLGIVNFALISAVSLFVNAGRTTMFYAALLALVSLYLTGRRIAILRPRNLLLGLVAIIAVAYFSVTFLQNRESTVSASPAKVLERTQRATYHPWVEGLAAKSDTLDVGLVSLGYFASPLPTLAFYIQREPLPGPFWGGYSYPFPFRTVSKATGVSYDWIDVRNEVFAPLESAGYAGNVWATWLRDLLIDFGYVGAVAFCLLFGAFMASARNRFEATGSLHYHYFEVLACFTLAFGAFQNNLWNNYISTAFFAAVVVMFVTRVGIGARRVGTAAPNVPRTQLLTP